MIGACRGGYRRSPGGEHEIKKFLVGGGGVSPMGVFFLCGQSFLSSWGPCHFFPFGRSLFLHGGGLLGLPRPPITSFCGSLLLPQIFIISRSWRFEFILRELFDPPKKFAPPPAPIKINNLCTPPPP